MSEYQQTLIKWARRRERIFALREKGMKLREIAEKEGITINRVVQILQRERKNGNGTED